MPPPITSMSTFFTRFMSRSILVETLAPPTIATTGRAGLPRPFSNASSSACMVLPAKAGRWRASPSVEACARWAAEKASLTKMSPFFADSSAKAGSFFSSPLWKRVFSSSRMSPSASLATASAATGPMQSAAKATGRPMIPATASAIGASENSGSGPPFGRPKCASRMTLAPLSASSRMVGATRSMRVASVTLPSATGTLRSTRTSTRLPLTSPISIERLECGHRHIPPRKRSSEKRADLNAGAGGCKARNHRSNRPRMRKADQPSDGGVFSRCSHRSPAQARQGACAGRQGGGAASRRFRRR